MERVWSALPDARDAEIERLQEESADRYRALRNHADETVRLRLENGRLLEAVQERDGVIERVLLRELRLREAITEANEAMRDGSDSTAWAILVAALAGEGSHG